MKIRYRFAALAFLAGAASADEAPRLGLPADCTLGQTCFIQQYPDADPGPAAQDFMCEGLSYDGHKGTDFGLPSLAAMDAGVTVIAAAPGIVRGVRDEMADRLYSPQDDTLSGRDCGNGAVIDHGGGWETQYCHLAQGSLTVASGDVVERGAPYIDAWVEQATAAGLDGAGMLDSYRALLAKYTEERDAQGYPWTR